ncbi:MAG TPA: transcription repressor NadR [Chloroflexota bacterium]|nr:transcription repressor NadR [Chloroflexota bacterium]
MKTDGAGATPGLLNHLHAHTLSEGEPGGATPRRRRLVELLVGAARPVTGAELAEQLGVSRQVVVQDCALLRAAGEDIISTPRGYLLPPGPKGERAVLASRHARDHTVDELNILVDHGLTVVDVVVEHSLYGELRGLLMLASRQDVAEFAERLASHEISLLSELTDGVHLHTVEAPSLARLESACAALRERGFLIE